MSIETILLTIIIMLIGLCAGLCIQVKHYKDIAEICESNYEWQLELIDDWHKMYQGKANECVVLEDEIMALRRRIKEGYLNE